MTSKLRRYLDRETLYNLALFVVDDLGIRILNKKKAVGTTPRLRRNERIMYQSTFSQPSLTASNHNQVSGTCSMLYDNVASIEQLRVSPRVIALSERPGRVPGSPTRTSLSEAYADAYHYIYFVYGRPKKSSGYIEVFYEYSHALTAVNPGPIAYPRTQEVA
jgi:hypothetical protein